MHFDDFPSDVFVRNDQKQVYMLRLKPDDDVLARENRGHVKFDVRIVCQNYIFGFKKFVKLRDDLTYRAEEELTVEVENSDFKAGFLPDVDFVVGINFASSFSLTAVLSELRLAKSSEDRTIPASIAKIKL